MTIVRNGDVVQLHYTTYAADGCVIETSGLRDPLEFQVGSPEVIAGINRAVVGMRQGERRRIAVSPEHAFGFRDPRLLQVAPRLGFLEKADDGDQLTANVRGTELDIWVRSLSGDEITLDANHPLAGESMVYEIEVVGVVPRAA
ncbi:MAG: FKBP-type peptidyl-prolyl cis-trans isomerase [Planctomycetes bacterium]|nr:FKBP-type peptidyl-prolyl cis-trans isomerase [Planctomycetota bacterium]